MKKKNELYLCLFVFLLILIIVSRFLFDQGVWRRLLLFLFPITLCLLVWGLKEYSFRNRLYTTIGISTLGMLFWYDFSSLNIFIATPFLSGAIALLLGYFIERRL